MAYYAVSYLYRADADVAAVRPEHRAYLATLIDEGPLRASGPLVGVDQGSALLIFQADNAEEVQAMVAKDPMSLNDVLESYVITEWNPVLGVFAS